MVDAIESGVGGLEEGEILSVGCYIAVEELDLARFVSGLAKGDRSSTAYRRAILIMQLFLQRIAGIVEDVAKEDVCAGGVEESHEGLAYT